MVQQRERLLSTNVLSYLLAQISLLRGFLFGCLEFSPSTKKNGITKFQFDRVEGPT